MCFLGDPSGNEAGPQLSAEGCAGLMWGLQAVRGTHQAQGRKGSAQCIGLLRQDALWPGVKHGASFSKSVKYWIVILFGLIAATV